MAKFEKIIVAIDFSDCSWELADHGIELALEHGSRVILLHVNALPKGVTAGTQLSVDGAQVDAATFLSETSNTRLAAYQALFKERGVDSVVTQQVTGPIATSIVEQANTQQADLIMMGTHGRRGMSRILAGSVAERVQRLARCPVMTFRTQHKKTCQARSCDWCDSHMTEEQRQLSAEADG